MINPVKMIGNIKSVSHMGETSVRTVILAGLGAYSKGIEQFGMAQHLATKRFNDLVVKGEAVEAETVQRVMDTKSVIMGRAESQFNRTLNKTCGVDRDRLTNFEVKIDQLQKAIDELAQKDK
ncbi:hypothetical protein [uncultured Photobacterium sp.]|uniref:phasin-related domain-containing protein n=1 Tax=uncultured Photobacterium sp. TaxID=173973 RepID=UPI002626A317|nr:hypothetical protein [uncultured Photobacterium sp.]